VDHIDISDADPQGDDMDGFAFVSFQLASGSLASGSVAAIPDPFVMTVFLETEPESASDSEDTAAVVHLSDPSIFFSHCQQVKQPYYLE
jgi:hypothetical protein